jgi:hypothetical protein
MSDRTTGLPSHGWVGGIGKRAVREARDVYAEGESNSIWEVTTLERRGAVNGEPLLGMRRCEYNGNTQVRNTAGRLSA